MAIRRRKRKDRDQALGFEREFVSFFKSVCYLCLLGSFCFMVFMILALFRISSYVFFTYDSIDNVPYNEVGLLLGTSSLTADGHKNPFFENRIRAATLLYNKGKIDYILVSGDNRHQSYNEPRQMMNALLRAGIPKDRIVADYAGFSTIDSVGRASKVFLLKNVTVITQEFHNERALFIASHMDLEAIGFNAADPNSKLAHFGVYIREFFARVKCIFDVYFLKTQPKFLGDPIQIGSNPLPKKQSNMPKHATSMPKQQSVSAIVLKSKRNPNYSTSPKEQSDSKIFLHQKSLAQRQLEEVVKRDSSKYTPPVTKVTQSDKVQRSIQEGSLSNPIGQNR